LNLWTERGDSVEPVNTSIQVQSDRGIAREAAIRYGCQCPVNDVLPSKSRNKSLSRCIRSGQRFCILYSRCDILTATYLLKNPQCIGVRNGFELTQKLIDSIILNLQCFIFPFQCNNWRSIRLGIEDTREAAIGASRADRTVSVTLYGLSFVPNVSSVTSRLTLVLCVRHLLHATVVCKRFDIRR
jgi:hypothetical protein